MLHLLYERIRCRYRKIPSAQNTIHELPKTHFQIPTKPIPNLKHTYQSQSLTSYTTYNYISGNNGQKAHSAPDNHHSSTSQLTSVSRYILLPSPLSLVLQNQVQPKNNSHHLTRYIRINSGPGSPSATLAPEYDRIWFTYPVQNVLENDEGF